MYSNIILIFEVAYDLGNLDNLFSEHADGLEDIEVDVAWPLVDICFYLELSHLKLRHGKKDGVIFY